MKLHSKIPALLLTVMAFFAFNISYLQAQPACPGTVPDCALQPWIQGGCFITTISLPNGNDCQVEICYCYRYACNTWYDFTITRVTFLDANCRGTVSLGEVLELVSVKIIEQNPWGAVCPSCPFTQTNWRVFNALCFKSTIVEGTEIVEPCDVSGTCFETFRVCCDPVTNEYNVTVDSRFPTGDCNGGDPGCVEICN